MEPPDKGFKAGHPHIIRRNYSWSTVVMVSCNGHSLIACVTTLSRLKSVNLLLMWVITGGDLRREPCGNFWNPIFFDGFSVCEYDEQLCITGLRDQSQGEDVFFDPIILTACTMMSGGNEASFTRHRKDSLIFPGRLDLGHMLFSCLVP